MNVVPKSRKEISLNDSDSDSEKNFPAIPIPTPTPKNFIFTTPTPTESDSESESESESGFGVRSWSLSMTFVCINYCLVIVDWFVCLIQANVWGKRYEYRILFTYILFSSISYEIIFLLSLSAKLKLTLQHRTNILLSLTYGANALYCWSFVLTNKIAPISSSR